MNSFLKCASVLTLSLLTGCQTGKAIDSLATAEQATQKQQGLTPSNTPIPVSAPQQAVNSSTPLPQAAQQSRISENGLAILPNEAAPTTGALVQSAELQSQQLQPPVPTRSPDVNVQVQENEQFASLQPTVQPITQAEPLIQKPRTQKTYLINGLFSAVPFIGYGFRNLHKKMPEAQIHSYISPVESNAVIMPKVLKEIEAAYKADSTVSINLIGISLGADFITVVAEKLNKKNIPVNYLGIVDGTNLRPITANVVKADNLTCTYLDCTRAKAKLARGNTSTIFKQKRFKSSHIPLGNNDELHARVIAQSRS